MCTSQLLVRRGVFNILPSSPIFRADILQRIFRVEQLLRCRLSVLLHVVHMVRISIASSLLISGGLRHTDCIVHYYQVVVYLLAHCRNSHVNRNHNLDVHLCVCFEHVRCTDAIQLPGKHRAKRCEPASDVFVKSVPELYRRFSFYRRCWKRNFANVGSRRCHWHRYDVVRSIDWGGSSLAVAKRFPHE